MRYSGKRPDDGMKRHAVQARFARDQIAKCWSLKDSAESDIDAMLMSEDALAIIEGFDDEGIVEVETPAEVVQQKSEPPVTWFIEQLLEQRRLEQRRLRWTTPTATIE